MNLSDFELSNLKPDENKVTVDSDHHFIWVEQVLKKYKVDNIISKPVKENLK